MVEQRRYARSPINVSLEFKRNDAKAPAAAGVAKDISVGGMFIATASPPAFGTALTIRLRLPGQKDEMVMPGVVRWTRTDGMGIQFGLLGARETHAITEIVKASEGG